MILDTTDFLTNPPVVDTTIVFENGEPVLNSNDEVLTYPGTIENFRNELTGEVKYIQPRYLLYNYEMMGIPFQIKPFDPFGCLSPKILLNLFSNSEFYKKFR